MLATYNAKVETAFYFKTGETVTTYGATGVTNLAPLALNVSSFKKSHSHFDIGRPPLVRLHRTHTKSLQQLCA